MTQEVDTTLCLERTINATPEQVFAAWTDPEQLAEWSCPEGTSLAKVEVDLKVGGAFLLDMRGAEGEEHTAFGTYREIDPPTRLVYTWDWKQDDHKIGDSVITVELVECEGGTLVTMTHELLPSIEMRDAHEHGWTSCLDKLQRSFA
jgi:uncharacterized protein YndB with AHSA1/START domain